MAQLTATEASAVTPTRRERMRAPVITLGIVSAATLALHLRDPHQQGSWGFCPSATLGIYCPGCGGLRAVNDLSNGDLGAAASSNLAFIVVLPFLLVGFGIWTYGRWTGRPVHVSPRVVRAVAYGGLALLAVFTVLRNLPVGAWLAP